MPNKSLPELARGFKQCQHCMKPDSEDNRLQSCSKCKRAHYCNRECQLADWGSHKPICKINRETRDAMKSEGLEMSLADAETKVKRWIQLSRPALAWGLYNALTIKTTPERISTHILHIVLEPKFTLDSFPKKDKDIQAAFRVERAAVYPIYEFREILPGEHKAGLDQILRNLRDGRRAEHIPHLGFALISLVIPGLHMHRFIPFGIENDIIDLPLSPNWKDILMDIINRGANI